MDQEPNVVSVPKTDDELLLEKRIRRRAKNKLKKEDMKRTKEEEKRRKLCEPKDQRVKVVNQSELATICKSQETISGSDRPTHIPIISSDDFPTLGSSKSKFRDRLPRAIPVLITTRKTTNLTDNEFAPIPAEENKSLTPDTPLVQNTLTNKDQLSKPKRKDPIRIDVLTAIKKCELPKVQHDRNAHTKKDSTTQRSGNQLDASNPERKKGKVREVPKAKKPSQLKRVILKERDAKRNPIEVDLNVSEIAAQLSLAERMEDTTEIPEIPLSVCSPNNTTNLEADDHEDHQVREDSESINTTGTPENNLMLPMSRERTIHTRKFREYCNHTLSSELDAFLSALITDIVKFQDRAYFNDPIKAHAKRRFVLGFREAKKYLTLKKVKLLIFAPDLEKVKSEGGIDDLIEQLKGEATNQSIPYVFGVGRRNLKKLTNKSFKLQGISCIGILNYEGAQESFNNIQELLPSLRLDYETRMGIATAESTEVDQLADPFPHSEEFQQENQETQEKEADLEVVASFLTKLKELNKG